MNCSEARDRLAAATRTRARSAQVTEHLESCPDCARFAARLEAAAELFRHHHAGVEPDEQFVQRVVRNLPGNQPVEVMGWAALRLLPLSLAATVVLAVVSVVVTPSPETGSLAGDAIQTGQGSAGNQVLDVADAPTDDVLAWVIEVTGDTPGSGAYPGGNFAGNGDPDEDSK